MLQPFIYSSLPVRVLFGVDAGEALRDEISQLHLHRVMVITTPGRYELGQWIADQLGPRCVGVCDQAIMHVPVEAVVRAKAMAENLEADVIVAIGGGSSIGLAKVVALKLELPIIAIPTTYSGSEMTAIYGLTEGNVKTTGKDPRAQPKVVIYDPSLTKDLPPSISINSGINAMAHAVEGLYSKESNPLISLFAEEGVRALSQGLPTVYRQPEDLESRCLCLYGAWLCGTVLGSVGMALHHKLCHTLGGSFDLPHAETHTVILPHVLAYNAEMIPEAMDRLSRALSTSTPAQFLFELAEDNGAHVSLSGLGMPEEGISQVVELALQNPYWNPRPVEAEPLRRLLESAYHGHRP